MELNLGYYFATDMKTNEEIRGVLPDSLALSEVLSFIKSHNKEHIGCGIIWVDPVSVSIDGDGVTVKYEEDDWAVWCNYDNQPLTEDNADISGNWSTAVSAIRKAILG